MTRVSPYTMRAAIAVLVAMLAAPLGVEGQRRGQQEPPSASWTPISAGLHAGYDDRRSGEVAGVQVRIPVLRGGNVELMPNANVTFFSGLKEYEFNLEAVYVTGGRRGGPYVGGGLAWRNSIGFDSDPGSAPRETMRGYSVVVGLKSGEIGGPFGTQLELRWIFLEEDELLDPRTITLGINFALWGRSSRGQSGF